MSRRERMTDAGIQLRETGVRFPHGCMIELLKGRPTARLVVTMTPQMKAAVVKMAEDDEQDVSASEVVRHLIAHEAGRVATRDRLLEVVRAFIEEHELRSAEDVQRSDSAALAAAAFVVELGGIVGWKEKGA